MNTDPTRETTLRRFTTSRALKGKGHPPCFPPLPSGRCSFRNNLGLLKVKAMTHPIELSVLVRLVKAAAEGDTSADALREQERST